MELKKILMNIIKDVPSLYNLQVYWFYKEQFKRYLRMHNIPNIPCDGEKEYLSKWANIFNAKIEPYSYRLFTRYIDSASIIPENIGRCFLETSLNPVAMRSLYEDKNMFPIFIGRDNVPATILCRINGSPLLDGSFQPITSGIENFLKITHHKPLIIKPSIGSSSGQGIHKFIWSEKEGAYISSKDGQQLTKEFLMKYNENFVLQKAIEQHNGIARFNPTSVNTLRIAVYRSWKDERPHVLASIMRVGKLGTFVDNAHAGGVFVGINTENGKVGEKLFDQYGMTTSSWNGVDYAGNDFYIPKWDEIKKFVCNASKKIVHHRLFAFDICLNAEARPMLIEYNLTSFSYWLFMFTGQNPLGNYTDEIIEFCRTTRDRQ